ncbi:DegQ family serine endoprotease [Ideonella azotifigens]|uniref:Probable periplasmic serine endoprotease DegP-like n=1 Tax=Ideonella azotifigens TaxID=513160 RepID=A0ABP3VNP1_9BURK|nr:DegQ family serine endoprotease [Ideonella azotifigens]MCD2338732.1 DegQ family serine endoprotease [Ideonella azotifigens]
MSSNSKQAGRVSTLSTVVITAGVTAAVVAAGSAGAIDFKSLFGGDKSQQQSSQQVASASPVNGGAVAGAAMVPAAPIAPLPPGAVPDYRAIVKQAGPAVVGVTVAGERKPDADEESADIENDPFFQFFRGMPGMQRGQRARPQAKVPFKGLGSGFVISADGLILTNAHVVRDAKDVTVKLSDHREYKAKVLGADPVTDIAVLRIEAKNLPVVRLGNSDELEVGDRVLAIGAPYGLEQTATQGIVSAKGRSLPNDAVVPFIQTDAAVNPGNSGGPLFDGVGSVVGINAQIYSQSGGFQGVSFAIPINVALKVKDQIVATGEARHGRLGVSVQEVNQALAESFGMGKPEGALVAKVEKGSAAAKAGVQAGDVITAVDGRPVRESGTLPSLIGLAAPGDKVALTVWREGKQHTLDAKLDGVPSERGLQAKAGSGEADGPQLGLALRDLNKAEKREAGVAQGLLIEDTEGAAARAGIQAGDVLLAVNGRPVQTLDDVRAVLKQHPKQVALLVKRDGDTLFVPVPLS